MRKDTIFFFLVRGSHERERERGKVFFKDLIGKEGWQVAYSEYEKQGEGESRK